MSPHKQAKSEGRYVVFNLSERFRVNAKEVENLISHWLMNNVIKMQPKISRGRPAGLQVVGSID
jgi:hypothetical protein